MFIGVLEPFTTWLPSVAGIHSSQESDNVSGSSGRWFAHRPYGVRSVPFGAAVVYVRPSATALISDPSNRPNNHPVGRQLPPKLDPEFRVNNASGRAVAPRRHAELRVPGLVRRQPGG